MGLLFAVIVSFKQFNCPENKQLSGDNLVPGMIGEKFVRDD